ncbi:hypothetical protein G647_02453 [Cladophialophora carrionii CBS 160.54]|uniref:BTB domain-containing protein n=1 Tax=Cladophialophora carrionii CBS 160.54 TaxID=1279043 RepID=V9DFL0_9EURO|nr:uncharacterized protein G647_02453 [Cladophialophora carrionii CBS 160.54]ETI25679.1 hypothetical protein G647_02453 [Cladophialophora carrionii CBS 160.54]
MSSSSSSSHRLKRKAGEMEDESPIQPRCIDVDPEGKVLVSIGKGDAARTIRVAGPLIGHAAPSFGPLSSAPVEGGDRFIRGENGSPEVYLDFFNIIHYKHANVGKLTGQSLRQLAELASSNWCVEVFKPVIADRLFPVIHEIKNASNDPTGMKSIIYTLKQHQVTFEELLDIAALCKMKELFWRSSKVAVAQTPEPLQRSSSMCHVPNFMAYGYINVARKKAVANFLIGVFECFHNSQITALDEEDASESLTVYATFHHLLRKEEIVAHKLRDYEGTTGPGH